MSVRCSRIAVAAVMSSSLLAGLAVAESSGATTPDTAAETSGATTPDSIVEASAPATSESADVEILPPDESWDGLTRGELDARSWQWVLSFPEEAIPWFDSTGERCGYGQSGPVFFLVPTEREITCVAAEGTAIWVMVSNNVCSAPDFGRNEDELRACATEGVDGVTDYQAVVNGEEVANLDAYRTVSPMFNLTIPENHVGDWEPGVFQAVSGGYSFIIAPPPPGQYEMGAAPLEWLTQRAG